MENEDRKQLDYPLDEKSKDALKRVMQTVLKNVIIISDRIQLTVPSGATSFAIQSSYMVITGGGACTIGTITGGIEGMELTLEFTDSNITITDSAAGTVGTINLSAAFVSTANDTIKLIYNGTSWREVSRSVN